MKKISLIIVAYRNGEVLKRNLECIRRYNDIGDDLEVIIVDNGSEENTIKGYIAETGIDNCIYINNSNQGYGAGNNLGVLLSEGEILGFINPDIYMFEPVLSRIYDRFMSDEKLATLGCKLYFEDMRPSRSFTFEYEDSLIKKWQNRSRNKRDDFHPDEMFTSGADLFIRKDLFYQAGKFDENYFMYYEEADLKNRLRRYDPDLKYVYDKDLGFIHLGGSEVFDDFRFRKLNESAIYYGKKWNLDYKKKIKYEYDSHKLKRFVYRLINKKKYQDVCCCIEAYEKYYPEYLK